MIKSYDFPDIQDRVKKLNPIVNRYVLTDVAMASFCISICVGNRSVLESILALNWALVEHNMSGKKRIETYDDFSDFYNEIYEIMKPDSYSDYIEEDFGEVFIDVFGSKYYVIVGTGHNMVYACLQFLPYLAEELDKKNELIEVLTYFSKTIEYLRDENVSDNKYEIQFILPGEKLFDKTKKLFHEEVLQNSLKKISYLIDSDIIEKKHFFVKNGMILPLANTSLLLDLYDKWYCLLSDQQKTQVINKALTGIALSLSKFEKDNRIRYMCPVAWNDDNRSEISKWKRFPFVLFSKKGIVIAINAYGYRQDDIELLCERINKAKTNNVLFLSELICRNNEKTFRGVTVEKNCSVEFLIIDDLTNPEENNMYLGGYNKKHLYCDALDVVYYLLFMHNVDELYDYIHSGTGESIARIIGFGGDSSRFLMWQEAGHMFEKGALKYGLINLGHNTENEFIVDYYKKKLKWFPVGRNDYILDNPFSWEIETKENGFYQLVQKEMGYGGIFCPFANGFYFFFSQNADFFNGIKEYTDYKDIILVMEDLFQRMLKSLKNVIESTDEITLKSVHVMMMPYSYAEKIGMNLSMQKESKKYIFCDSYWSDNKLFLRYVPSIDCIFTAISEARDRSAEVDIFLESIAPLKKYFPNLFLNIINALKDIRYEKKEISINRFQIEYKWNREEEIIYKINDDAFHKVRKHIAHVCLVSGIEPGEYSGQEATSLVRSIQETLIKDFEEEIRKYDFHKLYERALSTYATLVHEIKIHRKRYESVGDIKNEVKTEVLQNIINQREKAKHEARVSLYLLETVLFISQKGNTELTIEKFQYLMAYANWLVVLSDDADMCHFTEKEVIVQVTPEYLIDIKTGSGLKSMVEGLPKRMYDDPGFMERNYDEDKRCFEIVKEKFEKDTNIKLEHLLSFLYYLETGGAIGKELSFRNNIICFWKDDILSDFCKIEKISLGEGEKILHFVSIVTSKLKTKNGRTDCYLPIGEKEKRDNRYEVKPIYEYEGILSFAPVIIYSLREYWQNSIYEFCIPYEIGLPETKKALDAWKKVYEKKIVFDLEHNFKKKGFLTWHNFELKKINKGKYPDYLGDYDVFAVCRDRKEIWIVECKVLEKVETFYEMFRQQNRFFNEDKYDEKFQRRIDYMIKYYSDVLQDLKISEKGVYSIRPYMCMNKVFVSRYKDVSFPIVSYNELIKLIEDV